MSILTCDDCGRYIDTDDDPGAYDMLKDWWICESCREEREEEDND